MNDLILNIRFLKWHFQVTEGWRPRIVTNTYHCTADTPIFKVYQFGEHFYD